MMVNLKEKFRGLKVSLKINLLFMMIIVLLGLALFLINGIALLLSERHHLDVDLTAGAVFEVGEDTRALLRSIDQEVEIFVLSDEGGFGGSRYLEQAKRIIDQYPRFSRYISLEYVDYLTNPAFAVNFPELALSHGDIIVRRGERVRHVPVATLFHYAQLPDGNIQVATSRAEEAISSAILYVVGEESIRIGMLTGNGTVEATAFLALLASNNYEVHPVSAATGQLDEFDVLLLISPTIDFSGDAVSRLSEFLYNNGDYGKALFYTASAGQGELPNLDLFLSEWGISFSDGAVFETRPERTYNHQPYFPIALYEEHSLTNMLRDSTMPFLMPLSRPMELLFTSRDGIFVETLLSFSETSGVRPGDAGEDFSPSDAEIWGPMPAVIKSSFNIPITEGEVLQSFVIASASTEMLEPIALQNTSVNNAEYLLNLFGELTKREDAFQIPPTSLAGRTLGITSAQASRLGVILVGILPGVILFVGLGTWLLRRFR